MLEATKRQGNISDALRWVMGGRCKDPARRKDGGRNLPGTPDRKPMGFAKVALCIDNTTAPLQWTRTR
ncbi:MAG: hypothetical protein ACLSG5_15150 [Oscillospiraceae bacterium]